MTTTALQDISMPRLSDSMEEGTILQWHKQVGEQVAIGEAIVEVETDKASMDYESDVAGTLVEIAAEAGETVPIGGLIARIGDPDAAPSPAAGAAPPAGSRFGAAGGSGAPASEAARAATATRAADAGAVAAGDGGGRRPKASPLARRLAGSLGVDLSAMQGSGPSGRIVKADVEAAAASGTHLASPTGNGAVPSAATTSARSTPSAAESDAKAVASHTAKGAVTHQELSRLQVTVARRMAESKATIPHFHLNAEVDMTAAAAARRRLKQLAADGEVVPSFNDMVVKACAIALREHPRANGSYRDGRFELYSRVNVGIAVAAADALVVPTIFDADEKGLARIGAESRELARKVREGTIAPPELSGATFTVSNLGMFGVRSFAAVVNAPQAGILAVGEIAERPAVRDGVLVAAQLMEITLACDHRILYGADGAQFLARVKRLLEEPLALAL